MIPININKSHILAAIEEISRNGTPTMHQSKTYALLFEGQQYPPKYVISLANRYANGVALDSSTFSGGLETNAFLSRLGFYIEHKGTQNAMPNHSKPEPPTPKRVIQDAAHNERCPECKKTILKMLENIYGVVYQSYKLDIGTLPTDFNGTIYYEPLLCIYQSLQKHRGFSHFVRTTTLPPVDYFIPSTKTIIEFDESQHFTECRALTLSMYCEMIHPAFNIERWIYLCKKIGATDNDPEYRDEQRAWYDTLRDIAPNFLGLSPTVRLFSKDYAWCKFDPTNNSDISQFKSIVEDNSQDWSIEIRQDTKPDISRIIIAGDWRGEPKKVSKLLHTVANFWPKDIKTKFLITCGGFLQFNWPEEVTTIAIGDTFNTSQSALERLIEEAENNINSVLDPGLISKLSSLTEYLTIGVDSRKDKISTTGNHIGQLHVELVCLMDLKSGTKYWTGKSYPTTNQQRGLVRVINLESHFIELKDLGNIMILGCHDLTMFNNRNFDNTGDIRRNLKIKFGDLVKVKSPIAVLHHPHTTDCIRTWTSAWNQVVKVAPYIRFYASAGRYHREGGQRSNLSDVLHGTKLGSTLDFIICNKRG